MSKQSSGLLGEFADKAIAWSNAHVIPGRENESHVWRMDDFGSLIRWDDHGDRNSPYGWEIDHVPPLGLGFAPNRRTRALHWRHNAQLGGLLGAWLKGTKAS